MKINILDTILRKNGEFNIYGKLDLIESEFSRARRYKYPVSIIIIKFSPFSCIDPDLNKYTKRIKKLIREFDQILKIDDQEQIVILCPQTDESQADLLVDRLLRKKFLPEIVTKNIDVLSFPKDGPTFRAILSSRAE